MTLFVPIKKFRIVMDISDWRKQNVKPIGGKEKFYTAFRSNIPASIDLSRVKYGLPFRFLSHCYAPFLSPPVSCTQLCHK